MRIRSAVGAGLAAALAIGLALPTYAAPSHGPRHGPGHTAGHTAGLRPHASLPAATSDRAEQALAHARDLLRGRPAVAARSVDTGGDATLALRNLVRVRDQLRGTAARQASRLLARPATRKRICQGSVCVHWNPADVAPGYINQVLTTLLTVHDTYVSAGYRPPRPDGTRGGNNKTDVYIRDVGAQGLYGYCTTDKRLRARGPFDAWAYCVLDNDYRPRQFPSQTRLKNLQVTAAHEYFHAVQFAYDAFEDSWFMEATATWAEDEVYPDINDNLQYLRHGPLRRPRVPLDKFELGGLHQYGDWLFFRYLSERFPAPLGMSTLVRQMWRQADGSARGPDLYSMRAVRAALAARGTSFAREFALFADANRRPADEYLDGLLYPKAPFLSSALKTGQSSGWISRRLDHQSSTTLGFTPTGPATGLRVRLDMADTRRGSVAVVTPYAGGVAAAAPELVRLDRLGVGALTVPLLGGAVSRVEVTLVNASTRTRCWRNNLSPYSCFGRPLDDNQLERVKVVAVP